MKKIKISEFLEMVNKNPITERERRVLILRFLNRLMLQEVGRIFSVTRERVRMIEREGLKKLLDNNENLYIADITNIKKTLHTKALKERKPPYPIMYKL